MRNCPQCLYQPVKATKEPCCYCEITESRPNGTNFTPNTEDNKEMDTVSTVHANPDFGVGNTHVVDDGTAAASPHYNSLGVQPIEFMEDTLTHKEFKGFLKGNMIKYAFRAGKKDPMEKDVNKYNQYRDWYNVCCAGLSVFATLKKKP
ncbi:MAG: DUF3310 domain-containing protein [Bacilli bacterium]|nr:DUF3310 domain-containing protein [Bacilli bacterium]